MSMRKCPHCRHEVSDAYARVFSDNNGRLTQCPNCKKATKHDGIEVPNPGTMGDVVADE